MRNNREYNLIRFKIPDFSVGLCTPLPIKYKLILGSKAPPFMVKLPFKIVDPVPNLILKEPKNLIQLGNYCLK